MKYLYPISTVIGVGCLVIGLLAALSGGGSVEQVMTLGHTLIIAGAIVIAGLLIGSANKGK